MGYPWEMVMFVLSGQLMHNSARSRGEELLRDARDGDPRAFENLVRKYGGQVYQIAHSMLGQRAEAEDVYQEVFLKFLRSLGRLRASTAISAWLRKVTVRQCLDHLRHRRRQPMLLENLDDRSGAVPSESDADGRLDWLHQHLGALTARERAAVVLVYQIGLSIAECAGALGCSGGTVKALCYKGRGKLKAIFAEEQKF